MNIHLFKSGLALLVMVSSLAVAAATPEEEARFVDGVKKVFAEKKSDALTKFACWDGVSEADKKKQEEGYKALVEEKGVTFKIALVEIDPKLPRREKNKDGTPWRPNLKIIKQLDFTIVDDRDSKIAGIIGFAVGEKDGKLFLVNEMTAK